MRNHSMVLFCLSVLALFLSSGCIPHFILSSVEYTAKNHMVKAQEYRVAGDFEKAATEYAIVADQYSDTSFHKDAVYKTALMNMDSQNPSPDYGTALERINQYLTLHLSEHEKEVAKGYASLLGQIKRTQQREKEYQDTIKQREKEYQGTIKQRENNQVKMSDALKKCTIKTKELEDKLQKMKAIDVQMHQNRKKQP